jgi:hypothetical protein
MATKTETTKPAEKTKKAPVALTTRVKSQLSAAALRNKITLDELSDLEQHIKKLAGFMGA